MARGQISFTAPDDVLLRVNRQNREDESVSKTILRLIRIGLREEEKEKQDD